MKLFEYSNQILKDFMLSNILRSRYSGIITSSLVFLVIEFILRAVLMCIDWSNTDHSIPALANVFLIGLFFDVIVLLYINTFASLINIFVSDKAHSKLGNKINSYIQYYIFIAIIVFASATEIFFWDEFKSRFNFIAVDYLVYTQEVLNNIWESYNVVFVISSVLVISTIAFLSTFKLYGKGFVNASKFKQRAALFAILALLSALSLLINNSFAERSNNRYNNELAKNGIYSFFSAFRSNSLSYNDFYNTIDIDEAFNVLYKDYGITPDNKPDHSLARQVAAAGPEKRANVVMVVVESLSAEFLTDFGNTQNLTPNIDKLLKESLSFTNFYATGTRTTRGLEAIALSLPPTPGCSIVKRPDNANLFSLGYIFQQKGYETQFLYGGRGFFDNMNSFFGNNGFKVLDQTNFSEDEVRFSNAWGVCDQDLFMKTLKECDISYQSGKNFFKLIVTTSNHRPYTYPQVIGIPSGTGREGAVSYTDYAIGELIEQAKKHDWFKDTIFVIVADHCASSAGKTDLAIPTYHIPLLIYSPAMIEPKIIDSLSSQVDLAPTLLGLLNFSYQSQFYGKDILSDPPQRALIANYQKIGLYEDQKFYVLMPGKRYEAFNFINNEQTPVKFDLSSFTKTIAYYETAGYIIQNHKYDITPIEK